MQRFKSKIIGFALVLSVMLSTYTLIAQAVQQFNNKSLIDQLCLFGSKDPDENRTQFHAGEILTLFAKVAAGDVYLVTIYDKNGSVFSQNGRIVDSEAISQVPLNPPSFHAGKSYMVVFRASICCYPIPGAFAYDEKIAGFSVCLSETKLSLACDYNGAFHKLSLGACVVNGEGVPVANKTVKFGLQLNTSSYIQDRGWLPIGSAKTDANGNASFVMGCNLFSGTHYVKAEFEGDSDFGSSRNTTQFTVVPYQPLVQLARGSSLADGNEVGVEVTDSKGYPLMGKTVVVEGQGVSNSLCAVTDEDGMASVKLGKSELLSVGMSRFVVLGDLFTSQSVLSFEGSGWMGSSVFGVDVSKPLKPVISESSGGLRVSMSSSHPYAVLPTQVNATYAGWIQLGNMVDFSFLLDGVRELSRVSVAGRGNSTYSVPLQWCPDLVGAHWITVDVSDASYGALSVQNSVSFDIAPCPSNLAMYTPQVVCGSTVLFSMVFARATLYEKPDGMGLFDSFNLAPECILANESVCKIDEGVGSVVVRFFVNGTKAPDAVTGGDGVVQRNAVLPFPALHVRWNFTAQVISGIYENKTVSRLVDYTLVSVHDGVGASQILKVDCSVGEGNVTASGVYVGANATVSVGASLFGLPVWNAAVNVTCARFVSGDDSKLCSGHVLQVPAGGVSFLRVVSIYDDSDLNDDGVVDIKDISIIGANWLKTVPPGTMGDINHSGRVDIMDVSILNTRWQKHGGLPIYGAYVDFGVQGYTHVTVDGAGCARVPAGGSTATVRIAGRPVGAVVEFFVACFENDSMETDTSGAAETIWCPMDVGRYLVEARLPVAFNATVSQYETTINVHESTCAVTYAEVVKRPVTLYMAPRDGYEGNLTLSVDADASVWGGNPAANYGNNNYLVVCTKGAGEPWNEYPPGGEGWTFLNFNLYSYCTNACISSATLTLYTDNSHYYSDYRDNPLRTYGVHWVCEPWSESGIRWNNKSSVGGICAEKTIDLSRTDITNVTWDLTDAFKTCSDMSASFVYGLMIQDENPNTEGFPFCEFFSGEFGDTSKRPVLHIDYTIPNAVDVEADDSISGEPVYADIDWWKNGEYQGCVHAYGGEATLHLGYPLPGYSLLGLYNVTVVTMENEWYLSARESWLYDYRWVSNITCPEGTVVYRIAGQQTALNFKLFSGELSTAFYEFELAGMHVDFYVDGVKQGQGGTTGSDGQVSFTYTYGTKKTYIVVASFGGTGIFSHCNVSVCVKAEVVPVAIDFSASKSQLTVGCDFDLRARVINLETGGVLRSFWVQFCWVDSLARSGNMTGGKQLTNGDGVATLSHVVYPSNGETYAYYAVPACGGSQSLASNPLRLTVGYNSTLLLSVSRQGDSNTHKFMVRLVNDGRSGLSGRLLRLKLNDTEPDSSPQTTDQNGNATWTLSLSPQANNSPTVYNIVASFEGDPNPLTAKAGLTLPNGTQYDVCTTIQYRDYKPSANSTSILVSPRTTTGDTSLKSPEQMQKDAMSKGLSTWFEFSWWYPWVRLHVQMSVNPTIHVAFSPILPGGETAEWSGLEFFGALMGEVLQTTLIEAIGLIGTYLFARVTAMPLLWVGIAIEIGKNFLQTFLFLHDLDSAAQMLASAIMSITMMFFALVDFYMNPDIFNKFVDVLWNIVGYGAQGALLRVMQTLTVIAEFGKLAGSRIVDAIEITADFAIATYSIIRFIELTTG